MRAKYEIVVRDYIDAYNNLDIERMVENMAEDVSFTNVSSEEITMETNSKAEFIQQAEEATDIFSERKQSIKNIHVIDNIIEVELNYRGVIGKDVMDILKAGDIIEVEGKSVFTFNDEGLISDLKDIS